MDSQRALDIDRDFELWKNWHSQWEEEVKTIPPSFIPGVMNRLGVKDLTPRKELVKKLLSLSYEVLPEGVVIKSSIR